MDLVPDVQQISRLMAQATAPAFVLGAVAGFISILVGRMTTVVDRIRSPNDIADDDEGYGKGRLTHPKPAARRKPGPAPSSRPASAPTPWRAAGGQVGWKRG